MCVCVCVCEREGGWCVGGCCVGEGEIVYAGEASVCSCRWKGEAD